MNNTYTIRNKSIKDILDHIDSFVSNMTNFTDNHKDYKYDITIYKTAESLWNATINVIRLKRENYKTFRETV